MKLEIRDSRFYLDNCLYLVKDGNRGYLVYDDGEYEGRYVGDLDTLESMSEEDAIRYVLKGL